MCLLIICNKVASYTEDKAGLPVIPHASIAATETMIRLQYNDKTVLADAEFSAYTALKTVKLRNNDIHIVHAGAFTGTQGAEIDGFLMSKS